MIAPDEVAALGAANHAALDLCEIFMVESPGAFDVDNPNAIAVATLLRLRPERFDASGRCAQIDLVGHVIRRCGWGVIRIRGRAVVDHRRLCRRLDIGRLDRVELHELFRQCLESSSRGFDLVEHRKVRTPAACFRGDVGGARDHAILIAKERHEPYVFADKTRKAAHVGTRR